MSSATLDAMPLRERAAAYASDVCDQALLALSQAEEDATRRSIMRTILRAYSNRLLAQLRDNDITIPGEPRPTNGDHRDREPDHWRDADDR